MGTEEYYSHIVGSLHNGEQNMISHSICTVMSRLQKDVQYRPTPTLKENSHQKRQAVAHDAVIVPCEVFDDRTKQSHNKRQQLSEATKLKEN
jgi:hypothetical protein